MKIKRNIRNVAIVLLIMFVCIKCVSCMAWSENYTYDLQSIDNEGNYVSYNTVSSNTPAHCYEIINVEQFYIWMVWEQDKMFYVGLTNKIRE